MEALSKRSLEQPCVCRHRWGVHATGAPHRCLAGSSLSPYSPFKLDLRSPFRLDEDPCSCSAYIEAPPHHYRETLLKILKILENEEETVKPHWTAQINDLVGGWVVTSYPRPLSEHDHQRKGNPRIRGYVIAECMTEEDAELLASLLNSHAIERALPQ